MKTIETNDLDLILDTLGNIKGDKPLRMIDKMEDGETLFFKVEPFFCGLFKSDDNPLIFFINEDMNTLKKDIEYFCKINGRILDKEILPL